MSCDVSVIVSLQRIAYTAVVRTTEGKSPLQKIASPANAGIPRSLTTMATTPARKTTEQHIDLSISHMHDLIILNKSILDINIHFTEAKSCFKHFLQTPREVS